MRIRHLMPLIAAIMLVGCAIWATSANAYLHVANASNTCHYYNAGAADHTMMGSVGLHIWPPSGFESYPERGHYRYSNTEVWIGVRYHSTNMQFAISYDCIVYGHDNNHWVGTAWGSAVYYW